MKPKVTLEQDPENPIEKPVLAKAIVEIGRAVRKLSEGGLNKSAIIVLIKDRTGFSKGMIADVLLALDQLEKDYTR